MPRARWLAHSTVLLLVVGTGPLWGAAPDPSREYQIKAAFVYNVMKFVSWPDPMQGSSDAPVVVAVVGSAASDFESVFATKALQGRKLVVKRFVRKGGSGLPHVLFISADAGSDAHEALRSLTGKGVLTIGESAATEVPCMVALDIESTKLVFRVNLDAVEAHDLQISSSLLALAKSINSTRLKRAGS